ncbi:hypothetical protein [Natrinema salifodinae]|uniref:Uncharacterized protein n=1 Tax=Natrinema salifodinae TaxID=1202768 RepID=A0A1I0P6H1_9EURY|nr:hypothetical protein [Natrinema salifodinae]SEW09678.1 hypothetical protein SAMN05216285_2179 [Natrinema salifodinae]
MGYGADFINALRRSLLPQLHFLLRGTFGGYAVSHTTADEYVLTARCSEATIEAVLAALGFSRNPIAALKVRMDGNTSEGSWVWRPSLLADEQLHIVVHDLRNETGVDVYAHWEYSWIRHPYKHYVARGYDAERGVALARRWLVDGDGDGSELAAGPGIEYEIDHSLARRASEHLWLSYYRVEEHVAAIRSKLPFVDGDGVSKPKIIEREDGRDSVSPTITGKL